MRILTFLISCSLLVASTACHPGPVLQTGPKDPVGGTIAGIVTTDANTAVTDRKVTVTNIQTGEKFDATTGANGGYTIKVPQGNYRIEVQLQPGEAVLKQPAETHINRSDLDPKRDFVLTGKKL